MRLLRPGTPLAVALDFGAGDVLPMGRIAFDRGRAVFEADAAYLASGLDASAGSYPPTREVVRAETPHFAGLHGIFADSLPDSWGRLLLDRRALANRIRPGSLSALDRLACVGAVGMGALVYRPAARPEERQPGDIDLAALAQDALAILDGGEAAALKTLQRLGGSPGGARPKVLVGLDGEGGVVLDGTVQDGAGLPAGFEPWIVKFRTRDDFADIGPVEAAYMEMARDAGLRVPPSRLVPDPAGPGFFAAKRFDRDGRRRVHVQSLCAVLEAPPGPTALGYAAFLQATSQITRDAGEVKEAFRRAVFNVIAHNRDDHSKQHAFLMDREGRWRLSPAYDLTFAAGPGGEHQMDVAGEARKPGPEDLARLAESVDVPRAFARETTERTLDVVGAWPAYAASFGVSPRTTDEVEAGLGRVRRAFVGGARPRSRGAGTKA